MNNLCDEELLEILHRHLPIAKRFGHMHVDWTAAQTVLRDRIRKKLDPQFYENPAEYVEKIYAESPQFNRVRFPRSEQFWKGGY